MLFLHLRDVKGFDVFNVNAVLIYLVVTPKDPKCLCGAMTNPRNRKV